MFVQECLHIFTEQKKSWMLLLLVVFCLVSKSSFRWLSHHHYRMHVCIFFMQVFLSVCTSVNMLLIHLPSSRVAAMEAELVGPSPSWLYAWTTTSYSVNLSKPLRIVLRTGTDWAPPLFPLADDDVPDNVDDVDDDDDIAADEVSSWVFSILVQLYNPISSLLGICIGVQPSSIQHHK